MIKWDIDKIIYTFSKFLEKYPIKIKELIVKYR